MTVHIFFTNLYFDIVEKKKGPKEEKLLTEKLFKSTFRFLLIHFIIFLFLSDRSLFVLSFDHPSVLSRDQNRKESSAVPDI